MSSKNNSSWSNIICDGVPREDNQWWEERNNYLDLIREIIREMSEDNQPDMSIIGDKVVNKDIGVSQVEIGFQRGSGEKKDYYRRRRIPQRKKKKYPTKPRMSETDKWRKGEQLSMNREKYEGILS